MKPAPPPKSGRRSRSTNPPIPEKSCFPSESAKTTDQKAGRRRLEAILDSLTGHIAVIDSHGSIVLVNEPWKRFARGNNCRDPKTYVGTNYLEVCEKALQIEPDAGIETVLQGIRGVLDRSLPRFEHEYPCHSSEVKRWFHMLVSPLNDPERGAVLSHREITKQKLAEEKLMESEQRFRSLVETTSDWVWETDKNGFYTYVSPKVEDLLGYRPEEVIGKRFFDFMPADEATRVKAKFFDILKDYKPISAIKNINQHKDGRQVVLETSGIPIFNPEGIFTGYRGIDRDITARKRAEEDLKFQVQFIATLIDTIPIPVFYKDVSGRYLGCNHAFEEMFGKSRDEIVGKDVYDMGPNEIAEKYAAMDRVLFENPGTQMYEWKVKTAHGLEKEVIFYKATFTDAGGKVAGLIGGILDITQRKQVEEALRQSEAKLQSILRAAPIGIALIIDRVIKTANDAMCDITGYERNQLEGQNSRMLYETEEDYKYVGHEKYRQIGAYGTGMVETRWKRQNGKIINILLSSTALDASDLSKGIIATALDITKRKHAEETVKKREEQVRLLLNSTAEAIYGIDLHGNCTFANPSCLRMLGYTEPEQLLGKNMHNLIHHSYPDGSPMNVENCHIYRAFHEGKGIHRDDEVLWRSDGSSFPAEYWSYPQIVNDEVSGAVVTFYDITERKQAEEALRETNAQLEIMVSEANRRHREATLITDMVEALQSCLSIEEAYPIIVQCAQQIFPFGSGGLFIQDPASSILEAVNQWGEGTIGEQVFIPDDCWGIRRGRVYLSGTSVQKHPCRHLPARRGGCYFCIPLAVQGETLGMLHIQTSDEVDADALNQIKPVAITLGDNISLALANIRLRETLRHQVMHDPLTGLFNRRYLDETLTREIARVRRKQTSLGIIMMDLDHFKRFNDTYGHEAGDRLLESLGRFLQTHVRKEDVACRYGGEEFVVIMPEASLEDTQKRAEEIRQGVSQLHVFRQGQLLEGTTISLGVSLFPKHGSTGEDVLRAADDAMYKAKEAGRNCMMVAEPFI